MTRDDGLNSGRMARAGAKGAVSLTFTQFVTMLLGYAVQIAAARLLLPAGFGEYTLVISLLLTVEVLVSESPRVYAWGLARDPAKLPAVMASILRVLLPASLALGALFAASGIPIAAAMKDAHLARLLAIAALHVPFLALMMAFRLSMVGLFLYRELVISGVGYSAVRVGATVAFLGLSRSVEAALWAQVGAGLVGAGLSYALLRPVLAAGLPEGRRHAARGTDPAFCSAPRPSPLTSGSSSLFALWVTAAGALGMAAGSVDLWLLKRMEASAALVGLYSVGYALSKAIIQISAGLSTGIFPVVSRCAAEREWEKGRRILEEGNRLLLVAALPCVVIAAVCARAILTLFFSARYQDAETLTQILFLSGWASAVAGVAQAGITAAGRPRACVLINAAVLGGAVLLNLALIPRWGSLGAAAAAWAAAMSTGAISLGVGASLFGRTLALGALLRGAAAAAAGGVVAWVCPGEGWAVLPRMAAAWVASLACLWLVGGIQAEDRRAVAALGQRVLRRRAGAP